MDCTVGEGFRVISSSRANSPALLESWRERDTTARAQALRVAGGNLHNHNITWNYVTTGRVTVTLSSTATQGDWLSQGRFKLNLKFTLTSSHQVSIQRSGNLNDNLNIEPEP